MRKPLALALVVTAAGAAPASAATKTVLVEDDFFSAKSVIVSKGTTVRWLWRGDAPHDVVVTSGPVRFKSSVMRSGSFSRRVTKAGTYKYVCTVHAGMAGTLRVR